MGMPIREIKEYMDLCQRGDCTLEQRHNIILKQKDLLEKKNMFFAKKFRSFKA